MGSSKTKTKSQTNTVQKQDMWTPGTDTAKTNLQNIQPFMQDWVTPESYAGQRYALPEEINQGTQQYAQEGINAGMAAAGNVQSRQQPIIGNLYDFWGNITAGHQQNPYMDEVVRRFGQDFGEMSARNRNQRALMAGAEGAFGGTPYNQGETWIAEQEADSYGRTLAEMRYQDYLNWQDMVTRAPGQLGQIAQAQNLPAEMYGYWGGQRNANAAQAADRRQEIDQTKLDENYVKWLSEQEAKDAALARAQGIQGVAAATPGQSSYGTQDSTTTTTTKTTPSPGQVAASIGGAALGMFAPGGLFAASSLFKPAAFLAPALKATQSVLPPINTMAPNFNFGR